MALLIISLLVELLFGMLSGQASTVAEERSLEMEDNDEGEEMVENMTIERGNHVYVCTSY